MTGSQDFSTLFYSLSQNRFSRAGRTEKANVLARRIMGKTSPRVTELDGVESTTGYVGGGQTADWTQTQRRGL